MGATVLEQKHMIAALLYLAENDGCTKTELYGAVSSNPRMPEKLDALEEAGLITQDRSEGSRAVRLSLTDLGHSVATRLAEIEELMS